MMNLKAKIIKATSRFFAPCTNILNKITNSVLPFTSKLFCLGYILIIFSTFTTNVPFITNFASSIGMGGTALVAIATSCWIYHKKDRTEIILYVALTALSFLSYYFGKNAIPLKLCFLCFGVRYFRFHRCVNLTFWTQLICATFILALYFAGFIEIANVTRAGEIRNDFGFGHPNTFGLIITMLIIQRFYLDYHKSKQRKLFNIIIAVIFCIFNYIFVDSRASLLLLIAATVIYFIPSQYLSAIMKYKSLQKVLCNTFFIFFITTILLTISFELEWKTGRLINTAFSGRLRLYSTYLHQYMPTLFGVDLTQIIQSKEQPLDNLYLSNLLRHGIIIFLTYLTLSKYAMQSLIQKQRYFPALLYATLLCYGIMETAPLNPGYNVFILSFSYGINHFIQIGEDFRTKIKDPACQNSKL